MDDISRPTQQTHDDEIGLLDIYNFIKEGWRTLAITTTLVSAVGLVTAFVLPEKFLATAAIEPARVLGSDVEGINMLLEKMRSPTYYAPETFSVCGVEQDENPAQKLTTELKPTVGKQSVFVSVSFKSGSVQQSSACLNAVLKDVNRNQQAVAARQIALAMATLDKEKEKLKTAEDFISTVSTQSVKFDFKDPQFSASSLLLATLQSKQSEITELKTSIQRTELLLTEPQTKPASFATPIYAANIPVEPKRALIAVVGVMAGGFMGLLLLVLRRTVKRIGELQRAS